MKPSIKRLEISKSVTVTWPTDLKELDVVNDMDFYPSTCSTLYIMLKQGDQLRLVPWGWFSEEEPDDFSSVLSKAAFPVCRNRAYLVIGRLLLDKSSANNNL